MATEYAIFAGGCFWCLEALFSRVKGVDTVVCGYIGGDVTHPHYEQVCLGSTGHAEAVRITFDPVSIRYVTLLDLFFKMHDPTTPNRQGNDVGTQYRSAIFYLNEQQRVSAHTVINELTMARTFSAPIVTEIIAASCFYTAENEHQHYFDNHVHAPYCQYTITPKLQKFLRLYPSVIDPSGTHDR